MKPSERRALEAEKRAREAAEYREKELEKQAKKAAKKAGVEYQPPVPEKQPTDTERIDTNATYTKLPEEEIKVKGDGYHRESFWSNNARVIAFIITTVFALFVIGPLGYDLYLNIGDYLEDANSVRGAAMKAEDVLALADRGEKLTWSELLAYEHTSLDGGQVLEIAVDGTNITLRAERSGKNTTPDVVRLICYYNGNSVEDIRLASRFDIEDFIASPESSVLSGADGEFGGKIMVKKDVLALAGKGISLTWKDFEVYERVVSNGKTLMEIKVVGTEYTVMVSREKNGLGKINVELVHDECGESLNQVQYNNENGINKFFDEHSKENQTAENDSEEN